MSSCLRTQICFERSRYETSRPAGKKRNRRDHWAQRRHVGAAQRTTARHGVRCARRAWREPGRLVPEGESRGAPRQGSRSAQARCHVRGGQSPGCGRARGRQGVCVARRCICPCRGAKGSTLCDRGGRARGSPQPRRGAAGCGVRGRARRRDPKAQERRTVVCGGQGERGGRRIRAGRPRGQFAGCARSAQGARRLALCCPSSRASSP